LDRQILSTDLAVWTVSITNFNIILILYNIFLLFLVFFSTSKPFFYFLWPDITCIVVTQQVGLELVAFMLRSVTMATEVGTNVALTALPRMNFSANFHEFQQLISGLQKKTKTRNENFQPEIESNEYTRVSKNYSSSLPLEWLPSTRVLTAAQLTTELNNTSIRDIFGRVSCTGNQLPIPKDRVPAASSQLSIIRWHLNLPLNLTLTLF